MVRKDGAFIRKERITEIREFIASIKKPVSLDRTVAVLQLKHGLTEKKILEYLGIIETLQICTIDMDTKEIIPKMIEEGV